MEASGYAIILEDLSEIDRHELERNIPPENLSVIEPQVPEGAHGELITITAVVVVSVSAIAGFTAWALKKWRREKFELIAKVRKPDGTEQEVTIKIDKTSSTPPNEQVLQALAGIFKVPVEVLVAQMPPY
jgi:hypothetical protein